MPDRGQQKAYFSKLGAQALSMVLEGKLSTKQATEMLIMLRRLFYLKKGDVKEANAIRQWFKRRKMLKNLNLEYIYGN